MKKFLVEISARHIHLNREAMDVLFGAGSELHPVKDLSQPGQYASEEKLNIRGPKGELSARILGPLRNEVQVEVTLTEARQLGLKAQIRESGDLEGTDGGYTLVGPAGELECANGLIAAKRHIHMTPEDAEYYGVENGQVVAVKVESPERSIVFGDTVVRVSEKYALAMHVDTDESNAAGLSGSAEGEIVTF